MPRPTPSARPGPLWNALRRGPLLLDAAMGTRLIARGLDLSDDDPCLWNLDRPEVVAEVHRLDVDAGADGLTTNTFGANRSWLARLDREADLERVNRAAVAIARREAGDDRYVLGCLGPTATPADAVEQAAILADAGADGLILETWAACDPIGDLAGALHTLTGMPLVLTFALIEDDDPLPLLDFGVEFDGVEAVGWNCVPPRRGIGLPDRIGWRPGRPLVLQPSGPWAGGEPEAEPTIERMARLISLGVRVFGGCCGTTEADIAALRAALGPSPHRVGSA